MADAAKTVSVKLNSGTHGRIKHLADARNRTAHWIMREAIEQYVEREEKREEFREATLSAWQGYRETGLHLTEEEVDGWLAELAEGRDVEPPQCHV
ncbi:MAG: ribbon-helix-helix protein, CopG family [Azoarcus sp.]|jgi:predicted transcriptional regulator|nr:ribbon-helix-helix protein, CopG family [Azoarcus sp.]